jgi:hypothetical protein
MKQAARQTHLRSSGGHACRLSFIAAGKVGAAGQVVGDSTREAASVHLERAADCPANNAVISLSLVAKAEL